MQIRLKENIKDIARTLLSMLMLVLSIGLPLLIFLMNDSCGLNDAIESLVFGDGIACEFEFFKVKGEGK